MTVAPTSPGDTDALRLVIEGTVSETGPGFFRALVRNLASVMGTSGAWVTEYLPDNNRLRALAFWLNGSFLEHFEHDVPGTPCEAVLVEKRLVHYPDRVVELYPDDTDLQTLNAVSYLGVPLFDSDGRIMGHLAVLDSKPLRKEMRLISLFEIFAARASAECRRLRIEQEVRAREEELSSLLQGAMDGIVVLDDSLRIVRVNPAVQRLFGYQPEQMIGQEAKWFLAGDSAKLLTECIRQPGGPERQVWIPSRLTVIRADQSRFPAEATLSSFECRRTRFFTLILRNIDERIEAEQHIARLSSETEYLRKALADETGVDELLGNSPPMLSLKAAIQQVATTDATVLIHGETGTGKELVARAVHTSSHRKDKPMVRVNCAAIPGSLMESEFFGHEKGAFTGAVAKREGRFALADGGTIFLDEVGELPLDLQAKLLRVLQEGEFESLGSVKTRKVDVRVVAATNRDLAKMVAEGSFREDLYYRLNVFPLAVPALRERTQDLPLLAAAFQERFSRRMGCKSEALHPEELRRLAAYPWPGNIRELQNVIERAIILAPGTHPDLVKALPGQCCVEAPRRDETKDENRVLTASEIEEIERSNLQRALDVASGKVSGPKGAAALLNIPPSTFTSRMKALGVERQQESRNPVSPARGIS
ncbi:sigma 54-interacting transcriptional regulator [Luteolibacter luteus]|uniref:Sigma 54-interacting transcriptional regulator n=1 Tax=Luteolibacter luteus TaxID=2728835 RepID=A0A858RFJ2_9BACT|nr:sigma 54-interacting transcriptional regulator [Luteolibacter luteus]QJE95512.1 sigma 54-interacting transcriptional regulator [Luteolibacter luteus]